MSNSEWSAYSAEYDKLLLTFGHEQEMQALDGAVDPDGLDEFGSQLWNAVENGAMMQGVCPCGVDGCKGLDWLLDGSEPY